MKLDNPNQFRQAANTFRDFAKTIERHRREGFGWRYDGLDDWSTDAIFAKLRELGVDTDAERFAAQASVAGGFKSLEKDWYRQATNDDEKDIGFWGDFIMLSVPELWERFAGNVKCWELVERRLYKAITADERGEPLPEVNGAPATLIATEGVLDYLESLPEAQRRSEFKAMNEIYYNYEEWFLDQVYSEQDDHPELALRMANLLEEMSEQHMAGDAAAEILFALNRRDEALDRVRRNVQRYPGNFFVLRTAGDILSETGDDVGAIHHWIEALGLIDDDRGSYDEIMARLDQSLRRTGRSEELPALQKSTPRRTNRAPPSPIDVDFNPPPPPPIERLEAIRVGPKIGRNDPCPCGSGKKYKKCCLK